MSDQDLVLCDLRDDGVAVVTVNRPDKLNALDSAVLEELGDRFVALEAEDGVGCIVLTGSPEAKRPAFAAGADISEMKDMEPLELRAYSHLGQQTFDLIEGCPVPVIAAVNGFALGGGLELAMACTFRYAASSALMGQPEINLGLIPGFGGSQRLPRLVGRGRALELLLVGDPIGAEEAASIGLVNKVFDDEALMEETLAVAAKLASKAPVARSFILDVVGRGLEQDLERALTTEADLFGLIRTTDDVAEGLAAFVEKRKPEWRGH